MLPVQAPVPRPVPRPRTLPYRPDVLPLVVRGAGTPRPADADGGRCPLELALAPFRIPRVGFFSAAALRVSAAAASRSLASALSRASCFRRSASCCFAISSASTSATSFVEPSQCSERRRRWVCSVCERMRIQRSRSLLALLTVEETACGGGS